MTFQELEREFYEDLNGHVTAVRLVAGVLEIDFRCDHWRDDGEVAVTLECVDAVHWTATPSATGMLRLVDDHPLLWEQNAPHANLYFSSRPANAFELSGRLREAYGGLFHGITPPRGHLHASAAVLSVGYGMLARGPRPVLDALYRVAAPFVKCAIVGNHPRAGGYRLLEMDNGYVVCRSVRLRPDESA